MTKSNPRKSFTKPPRRSGTLAVGLSAIGAAWVLTACDPDFVTPVLMAAIPAATAAEKPSTTERSGAVERSQGVASEPIFGEVSSIEPIKPKAASPGSGNAGYRIHIRLENGGTRSFERHQLDGLDVGARVRVDGAQLKQV